MSDNQDIMSHHTVDDDKRVAWEAESKEMAEFYSLGASEYLKKEFTDLKHAFLPNLVCAACIDEGTAHKDIGGEAKFCLAGSGILYPAANEEERIQKVAALFNSLGIKNVTSHGGCGAAGLAYKRDFPDSSPKPEEIEQYAKDWVRKVAEEIGQQSQAANRQGQAVKCQHIEAGDMERPPEFHTARVVYYDGIGGFNPNKEIGLPMGFVIERKFVSPEYAAEELNVVVNIAFGHHGLGDLFTSESPFTIIPMAGSEEELDKLNSEIQEAIKNSPQYQAGKVKIDGTVI